jgi:hypothetical protein
MQIKTLFHVLAQDHPMLEYEIMFTSFTVPNTPLMHWLDFIGWIFFNTCMAKFRMKLWKPSKLSNILIVLIMKSQ